METNKSFETVDLNALENVVGGGKLWRHIKHGLKKAFGNPDRDIAIAGVAVGAAALAE